MQSSASQPPVRATDLAEATVEAVRGWVSESADTQASRWSTHLEKLLRDPAGVDFAIEFVDRVIRPDDLGVAAREFERLSRRLPPALSLWQRVGLQLGGGFAVLLPNPVVPITRWAFRRAMGHLVVDGRPKHLEGQLTEIRSRGARPDLAPLGVTSPGAAGAQRYVAAALALLTRPDVEGVSVALGSVINSRDPWSHDDMVASAVQRLLPLYEFAAASGDAKIITLEVNAAHEQSVAVAVFTSLLTRPGIQGLEAGIVVQACLPDALESLQGLTAWAIDRRAAGGAGTRVRLVKGAHVAEERAAAELRGWPSMTLPSRRDTDASYKRMLDWILTPERTDAVRVGVATHNLFDAAFAWLLAESRGVSSRLEFERELGVAPAHAAVVRRAVGGLRVWAPVIADGPLAAAVPHLVRFLHDSADAASFLSAASRLATDGALFEREALRFTESLERIEQDPPVPTRIQDRLNPMPEQPATGAALDFVNNPDTDPLIAANHGWARQLRERARSSTLASLVARDSAIDDESALETLILRASSAGRDWGLTPAAERAVALHEAGFVLAAYRGRLIEVLMSETGATFSEADAQASRAIDLAHFYGHRAPELESVDNAVFLPAALSVAAPSGVTPVADTAEAVLAALAAGSAVIVAPAHQTRRSTALVVEALWQAGVPRALLALAVVADAGLATALIAHPDVEHVLFNGEADAAALLRSWRPDRPLLAEPTGVNSIIVTPSADPDRAVADLVSSAFAQAGQARTAARVAILVASVAEAPSFRAKLIDAVSSLSAGYPAEGPAAVGPLLDPARGGAFASLTTLAEGEEWLVTPRQLDGTARLWSPGLRGGVATGAAGTVGMPRVPVLSVTTVDTVEEAVELQNSLAGLVAGIQCLDAAEIAFWLDTADSGNLVVNSATIGEMVGRRPLGGWRGPAPKDAGPSRLLALGEWQPVFAKPEQSVRMRGIGPQVLRLIEAAQPSLQFVEFDLVRAGAVSDEKSWAEFYSRVDDLAGLRAERNILRHLPVPVTVRLAEDASPAQLVRVLAAATRAGARVSISSAEPLPAGLIALFRDPVSPIRVDSVAIETDARWQARVQGGGVETPRIRQVGGDARSVALLLASTPHTVLFAGTVTTSGRLELLPFVREQSVTMTAHRFGLPEPTAGSLEF
jgi:RHH-type proline utilization regulon transcriptional repressor/proline dehydrogenase/delta 1-pyrroline-5-carboxylate dehydrogenase